MPPIVALFTDCLPSCNQIPLRTWLVDTYRTAHGRQIATRNFFKSKILYFAHRLCSIMQIFLSRDELFMDPTYSGDLCKTNYWVGRYSGLKKKLYGYYTVFPGDLWEVQSNTLWCCCFWCCRTEQLQHPQTNRPGLLLYWHVMWCDVNRMSAGVHHRNRQRKIAYFSLNVKTISLRYFDTAGIVSKKLITDSKRQELLDAVFTTMQPGITKLYWLLLLNAHSKTQRWALSF